MHFSMILCAATAVLPALAEELRAADVPSACTTICGPIVELTNTCDIDPEEASAERRNLRLRQSEGGEEGEEGEEGGEDDEVIEADCICTNKSFDVGKIMALCASCLSQNGGETEDTDTIMSQCGFSTTSYSPAATTAVQGVQVQATKPAEATGSADESGAEKVAVQAAAVLGMGIALLVIV